MSNHEEAPSLYMPPEVLAGISDGGWPLVPPADEVAANLTRTRDKAVWNEVVEVISSKVYLKTEKTRKTGEEHKRTIMELGMRVSPDTFEPTNITPRPKSFSTFFRLNIPKALEESGEGEMTRISTRKLRQLLVASGLCPKETVKQANFDLYFKPVEGQKPAIIGVKVIARVSMTEPEDEGADPRGDVERFMAYVE